MARTPASGIARRRLDRSVSVDDRPVSKLHATGGEHAALRVHAAFDEVGLVPAVGPTHDRRRRGRAPRHEVRLAKDARERDLLDFGAAQRAPPRRGIDGSVVFQVARVRWERFARAVLEAEVAQVPLPWFQRQEPAEHERQRDDPEHQAGRVVPSEPAPVRDAGWDAREPERTLRPEMDRRRARSPTARPRRQDRNPRS